jgi:hypothetical protein
LHCKHSTILCSILKRQMHSMHFIYLCTYSYDLKCLSQRCKVFFVTAFTYVLMYLFLCFGTLITATWKCCDCISCLIPVPILSSFSIFYNCISFFVILSPSVNSFCKYLCIDSIHDKFNILWASALYGSDECIMNK